MSSVQDIEGKEEFDAAMKAAGDRLVMVDFHADWCGPCRLIGPKMPELSAEFGLVVLKVDVDENEDLAEDMQVSAMPTFHFYKGGVKIDEFMGGNRDKLKEKIAEVAARVANA